MLYYKTKKFKTWAQFKNLAENSRLEWIFRGQSNSEWDLQTTLERSNIVENYPNFEDEIIAEFKQGARFYLKDEQVPISLLEWFSMIQHYGAPSRLLDFTKSPYIAAYFAFEQANEEMESIAIWIVNKIYLYQSAMYYFEDKISGFSINEHYAYDDKTFKKVFNKSKEGDFNCLFPIEPNNINQRYHLQQSIFICQGNPYEPLINQFGFIKKEILHDTIMKITIPTSEKKNAIRDLIKMNINRATLFPGLDGFAKSLLLSYENLFSYGDTYKFLEPARKNGLA